MSFLHSLLPRPIRSAYKPARGWTESQGDPTFTRFYLQTLVVPEVIFQLADVPRRRDRGRSAITKVHRDQRHQGVAVLPAHGVQRTEPLYPPALPLAHDFQCHGPSLMFPA